MLLVLRGCSISPVSVLKCLKGFNKRQVRAFFAFGGIEIAGPLQKADRLQTSKYVSSSSAGSLASLASRMPVQKATCGPHAA